MRKQMGITETYSLDIKLTLIIYVFRVLKTGLFGLCLDLYLSFMTAQPQKDTGEGRIWRRASVILPMKLHQRGELILTA
jgi:phage shock protein PspC (stress-responsive transcriptional regulator)